MMRFPGGLELILGYLELLLLFLDVISLLGWVGSWIPFLVPMTWFLNSLSVSLDFVPWLSGESSLLPGFGLLDMWTWFPGEGYWLPGYGSWFPTQASMVAWSLLSCLYSLPGSLNLVTWLPGEGSRLPEFSSWIPGFGYMVALWFLAARIHFLVSSTCFHDYLVKIPSCLDSVPASLDLDPWLTGEGPWLLGFDSWFSGHGSIIAW